ncbi:hypothetical protein C8J56DRAFT_1063925 [Mycena floridula]|nr:hypothetical protein C8J56DRAFT_1063925 [Mycena floridula]
MNVHHPITIPYKSLDPDSRDISSKLHPDHLVRTRRLHILGATASRPILDDCSKNLLSLNPPRGKIASAHFLLIKAYIYDRSMGERKSRERHTGEAELVAKAKGHDAGSVDIHLLNTNIKAICVKISPALVARLFAKVQPRAITPIAYRLKLLLQDYLDKLEKLAMTEQHYTLKRINCMIITDGKPSEEPQDAIIAAARRLEKGDFSPSLSRSAISGTPKISPVLLRCSAKETRDTIGIVPCYGKLSTDKLVKILVGGIVRREEA